MSPDEAARKDELMNRANAEMTVLAGRISSRTVRFWVPGRIEFLGKHTDYAGGRSLLCAADRGICLAAIARDDGLFRMRDALTGETINENMLSRSSLGAGHWGNYPLTVARRIVRNFPGANAGADIAFASDLPRAAGMSSSSALIVATYLGLSAANDLPSREEYRKAIKTKEDLAGYLGSVENGGSFGDLAGAPGVGTFGGSEDHTAILCGSANALVQYSFCPVRFERSVPLPPGHAFVIAASGLVAEKSGAARDRYNRLSLMVSEILEQWRAVSGESHTSLAAAVDASPDAALRIRQMLGAAAVRSRDARLRLARFDQFMLESDEIIPMAGDALARHDLAALGPLVDRSQKAVEQMLGNQIPETVFLALSARELGAVAASAFGAGFGGSVWALVGDSVAESFREEWSGLYADRFPDAAARAEFFVTRAGPCVTRIGD